MTAVRYDHRQVARVSAVLLIVSGGLLLAIFVRLGAPLVIGLVIVLLASLSAVFTSLTVRVTERELTYHFGLGVWRTRVPLHDIERVEVVRNRWWYGFGIRLTPHGWLYNVWGLDAVEITTRAGRRFRLGTDEPRQLRDALTTLN